MKRGLTLTLICAAALAAAPAIAQHRVSGTIGGHHGASASAHAATTSVNAPAPAAAVTASDSASAALPATSNGGAASNAAATASATGVPATGMSAASAVTTPPGPLALTIPTPAPAPASSGGLLQTTMALLFVLTVLVGLAWLLKRFGPKHLNGSQRHIKLVDSLNLGARERILLLEVGEQWIVVGASAGRMNALTTLARQELPPEQSNPAEADAAKPNFAAWLKQTIEQRHGK